MTAAAPTAASAAEPPCCEQADTRRGGQVVGRVHHAAQAGDGSGRSQGVRHRPRIVGGAAATTRRHGDCEMRPPRPEPGSSATATKRRAHRFRRVAHRFRRRIAHRFRRRIRPGLPGFEKLFVSPSLELGERRPQRLPPLGQPVTDVDRWALLHFARDQSGRRELGQSLGEHALAHSGHQLHDPGEPGGPVQQGDDDQAGPALAQQGEDLGDGLARPSLCVITGHTNV